MVRVLSFEPVMEFVDDEKLMGVALRRKGRPAQIALLQDPASAHALRFRRRGTARADAR